MHEVFYNKTTVQSPYDWADCDTCGEEFKVLIFVEEADVSLCVNCYRNRYGLPRLLKMFDKMSPEHRLMSLEMRKK